MAGDLNPTQVNQLLQSLEQANVETFADQDSPRLHALQQARALVRRLEKPRETLAQKLWAEPAITAGVKFAQDLDLCSIINRNGTHVTLDQVAERTGASAELLARFLRILTSIGFFSEIDVDTFRGTALSEAFARPGYVGAMMHLREHILPSTLGLSTFFAERGYRSPTDITDGPFQHGKQVPDKFFDWIEKHPDESEGFHSLMATNHEIVEQAWTSFYPIRALADGLPGDYQLPLVVDIGGGVGTDMDNLRKALLPGEFRLQVLDREEVVKQGKQLHPHPSLDLQAHDFFTQSPVENAQAYYMRSVLHDWPDEKCVAILQNVRPSMKPGFSKLLLNERVLPRKGCPTMPAALDLTMLALLCARERTEEDWQRLLELGGFRLDKVWASDDGLRTLLEASVSSE